MLTPTEELRLAAERMSEAVRQGLITKALGDRLAGWLRYESNRCTPRDDVIMLDYAWPTVATEPLTVAREVIRATGGES